MASKDENIEKLIEETEKLEKKWADIGVDLFQPGAIKEIKIAKILGHSWISSKHDADACDSNDYSIKYEYLSGSEGGAGQIDRFFKDDPNDKKQHDSHLKSMDRVKRNKCFYLIFNSATMKTDILRIYELPTSVIEEEISRQLANSNNTISHVSFNENFCKKNGKLIWEK